MSKKFLQIIILFLFVFMGMDQLAAQNTRKQALMKYISSLKKPGGGFGWLEQYDGHITPTFAVVGVLKNLEEIASNNDELIKWIETHHPQSGENKEAGPSGNQIRDLVFEQIQAIKWLGGDISNFKEEVSRWESQRGFPSNFEETKFGNLWQETFTPITYELLDLPYEPIRDEYSAYILGLQRDNGSFNNAAPAFYKAQSDGNILCTLNSIISLNYLDQEISDKDKLVLWLKSCQDKDGGFKHQPEPLLARKTDIIYTWAGIRALQILGYKPENIKSCIDFILSLQNKDGGFGNKPGLASTPMSTFYAIDALNYLNALPELQKSFRALKIKEVRKNFKGKKVFTVQFQSIGNGSPKEAVFLAKLLKIDLWGAKNAPAGWISEAQRVADNSGVNVHFFVSDEPYNKNIIIPGMGSFSHILDYYSEKGKEISFPGEGTWQELSEKYFQPLLQSGGGLILQLNKNEPVVRILLDESIDNGGYTCISTHHFDQNFAFWMPYLFDYSNRLPMVCLQDAHGIESWWWANSLFKERSLFISKDASFKSMSEAIRLNNIVSVRHDTITENKTRMMGADKSVRKFIFDHEKEWRWWNEKGETDELPWGIITEIFPDDKFEAGRPEKGVAIRIRCLYKTRQQVLLEPVTDIEELIIDGKKVIPEFFESKNPYGRWLEAYYLVNIPDITGGQHNVEVKFKNLLNGGTQNISKSFYVN